MTISAAAPTKIKGTSITTPMESGDNHTLVLGQLKEVAEIAQRLRGDPNDSFVRVSELVSATGVRLVSGTIQPPNSSVAAAGTVSVLNSITGNGSSGTPLQLVGDSAAPGNNMVYGTNGSGVKSWYAAAAGGSSPLTTKGDLYGFSTVNARIPVGADGFLLTADSTQALGLKWAAGAGGGGSSNITPDSHPATPAGIGLGPNDEFETGTTIDTAGTRYASATAWTAYNLSSGSSAVNNGSLALLPAAIVGLSVNGYTQPLVGTTWAYTCKMQLVNTTGAIGMIISVGAGKMWHFNVATATTIEVQSFNTATSFNGTAVSTGIISAVATAVYLRIGYDGTNLTFSYSTTGNESSYVTLLSTTLTGWLGVAPTLVGLAGQLQSATQGIAIYDWFRRTA